MTKPKAFFHFCSSCSLASAPFERLLWSHTSSPKLDPLQHPPVPLWSSSPSLWSPLVHIPISHTLPDFLAWRRWSLQPYAWSLSWAKPSPWICQEHLGAYLASSEWRNAGASRQLAASVSCILGRVSLQVDMLPETFQYLYGIAWLERLLVRWKSRTIWSYHLIS